MESVEIDNKQRDTFRWSWVLRRKIRQDRKTFVQRLNEGTEWVHNTCLPPGLWLWCLKNRNLASLFSVYLDPWIHCNITSQGMRRGWCPSKKEVWVEKALLRTSLNKKCSLNMYILPLQAFESVDPPCWHVVSSWKPSHLFLVKLNVLFSNA